MPSNITKPFLWRTSVINNKVDLPYKEEYVEDKWLLGRKQDYSSFLIPPASLLSKKNENKKYAIRSINFPKDTILVIPIPKKNKDFTTIKDFIDNSTLHHKKIFWKKVATEVKKILKNNDKVYISTHGLGIPYFHLRLDKSPKYYQTKKFIK